MRAKLTLMIEKDVVEKAKEYARGRNKSVSRIVEEYLKNLSSMDERSIPLKDLASPITDSLVWMFEDSGKDYKAMLARCVPSN